MITVGYGDIVPVNWFEKLMSVLTMMIGLNWLIVFKKKKKNIIIIKINK